MEKFQGDIKDWVKIDTELKSLTDKARELREKKSGIMDNIMEFVDNNELNATTVKISDGRLKFAHVKQTSPLTLKFVQDCLTDLFKDESKVENIMEYIKNKRSVKIVPDIKRFYNN